METKYNFDCGCSVEESKTIRKRRIKCPDHSDSKLINRTLFCHECGEPFPFRKSAKAPKNCPQHTVEKQSYVKVLDRKVPEKLLIEANKYQRCKLFCTNELTCDNKRSYKICTDFNPVFFGYDPKRLHDLMFAA